MFLSLGGEQMSDWIEWERIEFEKRGSLSPEAVKRRKFAELETQRDLQKPIQQLICDVQEGGSDPNYTPDERLLYMTGRMVSMMGRVALKHERTSKRLVWLSWILVFLTVLLAIETATTTILLLH
jgi:hypothetical protein